jgi:hypothetical protein
VNLLVGKELPAPARGEKGRVARSKVHALTEELRGELQELYDQVEPA